MIVLPAAASPHARSTTWSISRGDAAQVAALHVGVDVVDRLHVVVVDATEPWCARRIVARLLSSLQARLPGGDGAGCVAVRRSNRCGTAGSARRPGNRLPFCGFEPVVRRDLRLRTSETSTLLATSRLRQAHLLGAARSTFDAEARARRRPGARCTSTAPGMLRDARPRSAGRSRSSSGLRDRPADLDVDRRGQPEIQDLADDVGRLEEERRVRELAAAALRAARHVVGGRTRASGLSETRISPSTVPMVALSLKARLMPLFGRPMLSRITVSSSAGMTLRIVVLDLREVCSVSSRRVPAGARTCRRICPASTCGKKSRADEGDQERRRAGEDADEEARTRRLR